jgi:hypothetical protein
MSRADMSGPDMTTPAAPERPPRRRFRPAAFGVGVALSLLAAMWIYIFFFADTNNPNRVPDRAWAAKAETICKGYADQIKVLPDATTFAAIKPKAEAIRRRAVVGQQVTDLLTAMVASLRATPAADAVTADAVNRWLADYDTYLGDRHRHLEAWAAGEDPPFAETADGDRPLSIGMDDFSNANLMTSCEVPGDLG